MPITNTELQHLQVGGPSIQINVDVFLPNGTLSNPAGPPALVIESNNQPGKGTCVVHPTNPRAVILSPGAAAGGGTVVLNTDPPSNTKLAIPFATDPAPDASEIRFVSAGPVQP
jgi:hypothetical protein